jgi:hypothetical protein
MRAGEHYSIEWDEVDFETNNISVSKTYKKWTDEFNSTKAGY